MPCSLYHSLQLTGTNGEADRYQCKSQNVTQKPISHLQQLTSWISLPTHFHQAFWPETQESPFTPLLPAHVPHSALRYVPSRPCPYMALTSLLSTSTTTSLVLQHPSAVCTPDRVMCPVATLPRLPASLQHRTSHSAWPQDPSATPLLPPFGAHSPGLCLLTSVTLGQPALRGGHQGLRSFLEREESTRKHQECQHSRVDSDTERHSKSVCGGKKNRF